MMKTAVALASFALLSLTLSHPALSFLGWRQLQYAPVASFTEEDWRIFTTTGTEMLENAADGAAKDWRNPDTGASGRIHVLRSDDSGGRRCRTLRIDNRAGNRTGQVIFTFCESADGSWKVE